MRARSFSFSKDMESFGDSGFQSAESSKLAVLITTGLGRLSVFRLLASRIQTSSKESNKVREKSRSSISAYEDSYCKNGNSVSIRQSVFEKLDENPLLTAKSLCGSLGLKYSKYHNYVAKLRCE